ncbi:hypothetical protein [Roseibium aggregatum]|uniref:hypothetical protein n=1 Tax=Roseibium aggregatum TaxID=187304 RepID=UPI001E457CDC|nr:hypothetical protein [Roseibium aggregatum]UES40925.1 hypothetical protein GFC08_25570 [Roseibium aggregatum]
MLGFLSDIWGAVTGFAQVAVAGGVLGLAFVVYGARFHPAVPAPARELLVLAFGACLAVAGFLGSGIYHDRSAELEQAQRDLERWQKVAAEQAAQRERYQGVARRQMQLAQDRAFALQNMQEIVDDYEDALASGGAGSCAADDAYSRAMRSIRITGPETAETAGP